MTIEILRTTTSSLASFLTQTPGAFYVGRGRGSCLGNPFSIYSDGEVARDSSTRAFREYLQEVLLNNKDPKQAAHDLLPKYNVELSAAWDAPSAKQVQEAIELMAKVYEVADVKLVCFCMNKSITPDTSNTYYCHAETIAKAVMWRKNINS